MRYVEIYTKSGNAIRVKESLLSCFLGKGYSLTNPKVKEEVEDGR